MDQMIDLRPYVEALFRRWWVILGVMIAGALIAVLVYGSQTEFRATAVVAVTDAAQRASFDPRLVDTEDPEISLQIYPELARSDEVLAAVVKSPAAQEAGINSAGALRSLISVETASESRILRLTVRNESPELAADLANNWAGALIDSVNGLNRESVSSSGVFTEQLALASAELDAIEKELIEFQAGNRIGILENELAALNNLQATYLADRNRLQLVLENIATLRNQIAAGAGDTISWADQLTALALQLEAYEVSPIILSTPVAEPADPIQLQLDAQAGLTTDQRSRQLQMLDELAATAAGRLANIEVKVLELEPQIFDRQREREVEFFRYDRLLRDLNVARETQATLARKVDETQIAAAIEAGSLTIASTASPPASPARSSLVMLVATAALAGLLLSSLFIIAITWWNRTGSQVDA